MKMSLSAIPLFPRMRQEKFCRLIAKLLIIFTVIIGEEQRIMAQSPQESGTEATGRDRNPQQDPEDVEKATFGSGCFWCTEAVFQQLKGVQSVVSGYSGGKTKNPTYQDISTGTTGHAEVIQVTYDPRLVSYPELLEVFWKTHDPTTLNRQGADEGTQYRSVIFYHNPTQQKLAQEYFQKLDASGAYKSPLVTEIASFQEFYPGEAYHQNYFRNNPRNPYCSTVIKHKVAKFKAVFKDKLKGQ